MPNPDRHHDYFVLSHKEVEELLEPIRDHGHCWGFIAQQMISDEKKRKTRARESKLLGPYVDWAGVVD